MWSGWVLIYTLGTPRVGGSRLSLIVAIQAKGRCFSDLRLKAFVNVAVWIRYLKQINTARGYCWGPSSSKGPQKHNLTTSSKYGLWTGTFGLRIKAYTMGAWSWRRLSLLRSYTQGSFGSIAEIGTDLKRKGLFSPHRFIYKSIINVKGMTVISHRLRPVPINRWTVPRTVHTDLYSLLRHTCTFKPSIKSNVLFVIQYCSYISMII
jgi:hypothetical protein